MLILKQNTPNSVPTPPAGKGTIFLSDQDVLSVKTSDGNVEAFPTVGGSNTQIFYNNENAIDGSPNLVWNSSTQELGVTGTANVSGNIAVGGIKTDNYYYANGQPLDFEQPAGSNTQVIYNNGGNFGASANFTFNSATNVLDINGNIAAGNVSATTVSATNLAGTLTTAAQPNITSLGTLTSLTTSGNAVIGGNLTVNGNITYVNVETFDVEDPIISVGGGPNGAVLTSNDGKDRGLLMHYYANGQPIDAFMGWDNSNGEFAFGSDVTTNNDVETFNQFGNVRARTFLGNVAGATGNFTGNVSGSNANFSGSVSGATANFTGNLSAANANLGNLATANYVAGVLTTAGQPNVTSVGTLTTLQIGATADLANDFPAARAVSSQDNTGEGTAGYIGLAGEAVANASSNSLSAFGLYGVARANGAAKGTGVQGTAVVTNTADTGAAVGVRGYATATHSGGYNIGVLGNAIGSGVGNYAFYVQNGGIASIENDTFWDLADNSATALTFNSTGKANIFGIETTDNAEGIFTSGYLNVTGNASVGGLKTDNLYYANGTPWDLQEAAGSNNEVQFNSGDNFAASANFTFNPSTNVLNVAGNIAGQNVNAGNLLTANYVAGTLTTAAQPNVTSVGTLTSLSVTGNVSAGNVSGTLLTGTLATAAQPNITSVGTLSTLSVTGNVSAGNVSGTLLTGTLATAAQPNVTSVGTLTSLTVSGNASAGNLNTAGKVIASSLESNVATGTAPFIVASSTKVANLNVDLVDGFHTDQATSANTIVVRNADGNIVATNASLGNLVTANYVAGTLTTAAQPNITSVGTLTSLAVTGNVSAGNVSATGISGTTLGGTLTTAAQPNITSVGTLTSLSVTGNVSAGNVSGTLLTGTLTTAAQPNVTSLGTLTSLDVTGNIGAGNVSATDISGTTLGGTLTTAAQPNITSVGTLTSLGVTGNISGANLIANTKVVTDAINNKSGNLVITTNSNVLFSTTGVIDAGNSRITSVATPTSDADAATKLYVDNLVSSGIHYHQPVRVESPTALNATYNNGSSGVGATLTNAGSNVALSIDGISLNVADRVLVYTQANAVHNGVYVVSTVGNASTAWVLTRASDADTYAPSTDNGLDEGSYFFVQEGVTGAGESYVCSTPGTITFGTTAINFAQFSKAPIYTAGTGLGLYGNNEFYLANTTVTAASYGNGDRVATFTVNSQGQLTAASNVAIAANAANLTGTTLASSIVNSSLTSVGTLGSLSVTGNVSAGNVSATDVSGTTLGGTLTTAAQPNITSVGTLSSLSVTGNVSAGNVSGTLLTGTLTTAAQPNITSVGTLSSLSVTGNANVGNIGAAAGVFTTVAGSLTTAAQPNVTSLGTLTGLGVNGNITAANITANTGVFTGNGSGLTALNASNISSGTLAQARLANSSLTVNGQTISLGGSGTITANTNQTLTLGSYLTGTSFNGGTAVTAAVDATSTNTASKVVARDASGNFSAGTITATLSGAATTAGTVTTAAQPNITSVGTLTSLSVSGALTTTNITTGANTTAGSITGNWSLTAGSRLNATYADLAERYVADDNYEPGTVLLFGGEQEVTMVGSADSTRVAGVVTTNPAYLMNSECEGEFVVDIALIGRVPIKVQGPITKGDLLVSSEMPGFAKANNEARAGTIIGKALQSYNGPTPDGVIEAMVGRC